MGAICGIKQASFDGVDCVGEDDAATGTVRHVWTEHLSCKRYSRTSAYLPLGRIVVKNRSLNHSIAVDCDGDR